MSGNNNNVYADLLQKFNARCKDYLFRLTTDEATFLENPEANGVAKRRGYLKGRGPRLQCSLLEQDAAAVAADDKHHLVVWTDSPCLRAGVPEPWDTEDLHGVIARLFTRKEKDEFIKSIPIPELLNEHGRVPGFRSLLKLMRQLTLCGRGDFRIRIRALLINARDGNPLAPDYNPGAVFDSELIERVIISLDGMQEPSADDHSQSSQFAAALSKLLVEKGQSPSSPANSNSGTNEYISPLLNPSSGDEGQIGVSEAEELLKGLYSLLPASIASDLVQAAIEKGRPGPYQPHINFGGWEPPPRSDDRPPVSGDRPPDSRDSPGSFGAWEKPTGGWDNPNAVPPPRGDNMLFRSVWEALNTLSFFGRIVNDEQYTVRSAALAMRSWLWHSSVKKELPMDTGASSLVQEIFEKENPPLKTDHPGYPVFAWPPYTPEGVYWWRTFIKPQCMDQCFALNETADFHTTDIIRFLNLFPDGDERVPDYVYADAKLALLWFKYWWDEPPAGGSVGAKAEMTMWSENHQILFAQSQLLAGVLFRSLDFLRSGTTASGAMRTGQDHINEALLRTERWLDLRLKFGFSEWNAPGYYNEDFPPLFNLMDFCNPDDKAITNPDERTALRRIKIKAAMVLDIMIFDCARFTCRGSFGVTSGRAYWEHKSYGWEQSIGNTIEILFGTRGDFQDTEPAAVALATSTYRVPEALLAIGLDRVALDQSQPFTDRTRVSINFDEAEQFGIGFKTEEDAAFWWGLEAYYTDQTMALTKEVVERHPNLQMCGPFEPMYAISQKWFIEALVNLISITLDYLKLRLVAALPGVLALVALVVEGKNIVEGVVSFFKDIWEYLSTISKSGPWKGLAEGAAGGALVAGVPGAIVGGAAGFFTGLFGGGDKSDQPHIPDNELQKLLEKLLVSFNKGTVLSTANIVAYNNGDAMLSSVQNHLPGLVSFQKQPWMANLGCDACVWTTARFMSPDLGSYVTAWGRFFKDIGHLRVHEAVADVLETPALQIVGKGSDLFGHDGPNYWTGSLALPMIVQYQNAAIIAYNIPELQRTASGFATHAWFPKEMFDETRKQNTNGGTWFLGRKDHFQEGGKVGSGYVALFSAIEGDWTNEPGNAWNNKEIQTKAGLNFLKGSNIYVSVVSNEQQYREVADGKRFDAFCKEIENAYLHISGVGSVYNLECSFDIPRTAAPEGRSPRLELFYSDDQKTGRFAGDDLQLDNFPRFENKYVNQMVSRGPSGSGLRPQVQEFTTVNGVGFGSTAYQITHPLTGLTLDHNTTLPERRFTSQQPDKAKEKISAKRLHDGSLTAVRTSAVQTTKIRPLPRPKLDTSIIKNRKK